MRTRNDHHPMLAVTLLLLLPVPLAARCDYRLPIEHAARTGAFDFTYTEFEGGPGLCQSRWPWPIRFWHHGQYAVARFDPLLARREPCYEPWLNRALDLEVPGAYPNQWSAVHEDWYGEGSTGCPSTPLATVVEASFVDGSREGTDDHRGLYAVAVVSDCSIPTRVDLDAVRGGVGPDGNIVVVRAIPPPVRITRNGFDGLYHHVTVGLDDAASHGTPGHLTGVYGYVILYKLSPASATSSLVTSGWEEVREPWSPSSPLGPVPLGTSSVEAWVPDMFPTLDTIHFATQLVYESADGPRSEAVSSHRTSYADVVLEEPDLRMTASMMPSIASPGDPVRIEVRLETLGAARNVELWDVIGQDLAPGCLDLATARNVTCTGCDAFSWDAALGRLRGQRSSLPRGDEIVLGIEFDAGSGAAPCEVTPWATAERHRYVNATAALDNSGVNRQLLRDDSILSLTPRPDFAAIFPLPVYRDPAPPLPFTDEVNLLEAGRPLVLYGYTGAGVLRLIKDKTPGVNSVVISP